VTTVGKMPEEIFKTELVAKGENIAKKMWKTNGPLKGQHLKREKIKKKKTSAGTPAREKGRRKVPMAKKEERKRPKQ